MNPAAPTVTAFGLMLVNTGTGLVPGVMLNVRTFDTPPPGVGLKTVTLACPVPTMSEARICAVNCVALTKFVVRFAPSQRTTDPATKPVPLTVRVKLGPPSTIEVGLRLETVGTGLG